jgi:hypothetical protein
MKHTSIIEVVDALLNPSLDRVDFILTQRSVQRHLSAILISDKSEIQVAGSRATRSNHRARAAPHGISPPIEAKAVLLFVGTVAINAMCL